MSAETKEHGFLRRAWARTGPRLKSCFGRRDATEEYSEERRSALLARHQAEARRDDHHMTVRIHEPMF
ncbi:MAG: hypothetical protein O2912_04930 [Proteobacteria bacterium]|nr:hypothetical protein [Pseudomonadota bacterium]